MKRKEENEMSATPTRFRAHHSIPVARSFWEIEGGERDIWRSGMALPRDSALLLGAAKRLLRCNSPSRHRCGAYRLRMARLVVNVSDVNGAASPGCRRNAAAPPAERFYCAHVAPWSFTAIHVPPPGSDGEITARPFTFFFFGGRPLGRVSFSSRFMPRQ